MKTFKVTFFDKELDVFKVETFHNVTDQSALTMHIAILIDTLELHEYVKAEAEGKSYTQVINYFIHIDLDEIRKN
jgi:hypothetical protein